MPEVVRLRAWLGLVGTSLLCDEMWAIGVTCPRWAWKPRWCTIRGIRGGSSLSVVRDKTTHRSSVAYPLRTIIRGRTDR